MPAVMPQDLTDLRSALTQLVGIVAWRLRVLGALARGLHCRHRRLSSLKSSVEMSQ